MSNYMIPTVQECEQMVEDKKEFRRYPGDGFMIYDYVISDSNTFDDTLALEMRGIAFDAEGQVVSLPLHKFFNVGEKESTQASVLDFSSNHSIDHKLDGSMIRTIRTGDSYRLGTRAGVTTIAMMAEEFVAANPAYHRFIKQCINANTTAIFEFCSRKNRVVVDHPVDRLVLLAIRRHETGEYVGRKTLESLANLFGIELVQEFSTESSSMSELVSHIAGLEGEEGIVMTFHDSGLKVKIKADDYVKKHRVLSHLSSSRAVMRLILSNGLDDIIPILNADDSFRIQNYRNRLTKDLINAVVVLTRAFEEINELGMARKDFAARVMTDKDLKPFAPYLFQLFDGKDPRIMEEFENANNKTLKELAALHSVTLWEDFK